MLARWFLFLPSSYHIFANMQRTKLNTALEIIGIKQYSNGRKSGKVVQFV